MCSRWLAGSASRHSERVQAPGDDDEEPRVSHYFEVRDDVETGGVEALWSVTRGGPPPTGNDSAEWADWDAAAFTPLESENPSLAHELKAVFAEAFIRSAGLSQKRLDQAANEVVFEVGATPKGVRVLRAHLPLGAGHPEYEWDGSPESAGEVAASMAETAGRTIVLEREEVGTTGWESEYD